MTNLGFSWGFEPKFSPQQPQPSNQNVFGATTAPAVNQKFNSKLASVRDKKSPSLNAMMNNSSSASSNRKLKRKMHFEDDSAPDFSKNSASSRRNIASYKSQITKSSHKKIRNPANIAGKQLPVFRLIELLDKKQLTDMILNLMDKKPELNQVIFDDMNTDKFGSITNPSVEKSISYLETFLQEKVLDKLPYKVEPESEYSFLRVQKNLVEFYTILSDFILNYLPPKEKDFTTCLKFIDETTNLIHKIPFFKINKFNMYHYINIYEQITNAWWNILTNFLTTYEQNENTDALAADITPSENDLNVFHMLEFNLLEKLYRHQEKCHCDKFDRVIEFVKMKVDDYQLNNSTNDGNYMLNSRLSIANNLSGYGNFNNNFFDSFANEYLNNANDCNSSNNLDANVDLESNNNTNNPQLVGTNFSSNNNPINHKPFNSAIMDSTLR